MTCEEIGKKIDVHLKRFEASKKINRPQKHTGMEYTPYWQAWSGGYCGWVRICYVSYQGSSAMRKDDAAKYLAWLDAGNVGKHYDMERAVKC